MQFCNLIFLQLIHCFKIERFLRICDTESFVLDFSWPKWISHQNRLQKRTCKRTVTFNKNAYRLDCLLHQFQIIAFKSKPQTACQKRHPEITESLVLTALQLDHNCSLQLQVININYLRSELTARGPVLLIFTAVIVVIRL